MDATYFVGLADRKDNWHEGAAKISEDLLADATTSDYVISESVTILGDRSGGEAALDLYDFIIDNFQVVYVAEDLLRRSMDIYAEHGGILSMADATSVEIMRQEKISKIISFDEDFDDIDGIERIHG